MVAIFDALSEPIAYRVTAGLARIGHVLRTRARAELRPSGVTPSQAQTLAHLHDHPASLRELAGHLGVSSATASVAVRTLIDRGLVDRRPGVDRRTITLALTEEGERLVAQVGDRQPSLTDAVELLDPQEQSVLLVALVKVIKNLQAQGELTGQRMCVTCVFFQPYEHVGSDEPHRCAFVDAAFADRHLRLDCKEQQVASAERQEAAWARFTSPDTTAPLPPAA